MDATPLPLGAESGTALTRSVFPAVSITAPFPNTVARAQTFVPLPKMSELLSSARNVPPLKFT